MRDGRLAGSFRDPSGFVFQHAGVLYRQVNAIYSESYDELHASGLYDELVAEHLLIAHEEQQPLGTGAPDTYRVLRPERVPFVSYPYCWCFSQLKDAALATLEIQRRAMAKGMGLKDASAYNIQFHKGRPILIDTLSFEPYREGEPWLAYHQFCEHFLAPLLLMSGRDARLAGLMRLYLDGIPLDLASKLLPRRSWLRLSPLLHVHLHARSIHRHAGTSLKKSPPRSIARNSLLGLIDSLEGEIRRLEWAAGRTEWSDYAVQHNYGDRGMDEKRRLVRALLTDIMPGTVWDLGANTGAFSRIAAELGAHVVAFDGDAATVERAYLRGKEAGEQRILPLWMDLANPSPALGWAHEERESLVERGPVDLVMALALIHHLAISNNVPLDDIADFFARLGSNLIAEFVPKSDSQVQRLLSSRRDVFDRYDRLGFESAFQHRYNIVAVLPIGDTGRTLYHMTRR